MTLAFGWMLMPFFGAILWAVIIALLFAPLYRRLTMLGGIAFWFLGISGPLLWAVLMAFLSLLPAVGSGLVWVPVALYFFVTGAIWQGLALTAYGVLVIGLIDDPLRPALVGKDTGLPDYLVMICTLGGMAVFGLNGFVIGPLISALFMAVWHIHLVQLASVETACARSNQGA